MNWDLFISHASEDKSEVATPLATAFQEMGFSVWFDAHVLEVGDSLRTSIDEGLSQSRYGVVILSPAFFRKEWTRKELNALVSLESEKRKRILPVWHNVSRDEVARFSPILADRLAVSTERGIEHVITAIVHAYRNEKYSTQPAIALITSTLSQDYDIPSNEISGHAEFEGALGLDSLDVTELIMSLEKSYGIKIPLESFRSTDGLYEAHLTVAQLAAEVERIRAAS